MKPKVPVPLMTDDRLLMCDFAGACQSRSAVVFVGHDMFFEVVWP
jgi:hypothetical protein